MEYVWPASDDETKEQRKHSYASKFLWGFDFDERSARVARALMLIAGDGRSHVFRANGLDPREWFTHQDGEGLRSALREHGLLVTRPHAGRAIRESEAWEFYRDTKFDVILTNPPFAGEIRDQSLLQRFELAGRALDRKGTKGPKEERDVLFIERCLNMLKAGGRVAIILPQGKVNNASLSFIRSWILSKARLLAVVGLHPNTFKPHTGTKTSVLLLQKYTEDEADVIRMANAALHGRVPDYEAQIRALVESATEDHDVDEQAIPEDLLEILLEMRAEAADASPVEDADGGSDEDGAEAAADAESLADEVVAKRGMVRDLNEKIEELSKARSALTRGRDGETERSALREHESRLKGAKRIADGELDGLERRLAMLTVGGS